MEIPAFDSSGKHIRQMYTPLNPLPHFYKVKLGFAEAYFIFLFWSKTYIVRIR